ncbi:uncharacterized protein LOC125590606 [Brassica napus]|uniref:uncharacterized protein LOC125590606 n=1 Tax=Brassica napus TaxID=3708 RepID=UPI00207AB537|nr:uncharacterized protein LOC125590606 [Brassica napus]
MVSSVALSLTPDPPDEDDMVSPDSKSPPPLISSSAPAAIPSIEAPFFAQRFKNSLRNLRKISSPTCEIDGIPVVLAPDSVVLQASEAWKDHIIAHFHGRCSSPSKIYDDLNPGWGKHGNITVRTLSQTAALIFVPSTASREWVLQVGYWQVDNCALTALPWTPGASLELQDLVTAPTWAVLKNVPPQLYSLDGISVTASGIGEPLHTENSRDTRGYSVRVNVEYTRLPPKCCNCGKFGHMLKYCTLPIHRKNFKQHQSMTRVSSSAAQVTVENKDLSAPDSGSIVELEKDSNDTPISDDPSFQVLPQVVEDVALASSSKSVAGVASPQKKPSVLYLSHRKDKNKKLRVPSDPAHEQVVVDTASDSHPQAPVDVHSFQSLNNQALPPDIALEEGEIPFQPSPAALKKARRIKRQEALLAAASPSSAVSLLFSSIRGKGFNQTARQRFVKSWLTNNKPVFGGILENRVSEENAPSIMASTFPGWRWDNNYSYSDLGRIWIIWDPVVSVVVYKKTAQFILCGVFDPATGTSFSVAVVYSFNTEAQHSELWQDLTTVNTNSPLSSSAWLLLGDFNQILSSDEHYSIEAYDPPVRGMEEFRTFLDSNDLTDLNCRGTFYTWNNSRPEDPILRKLDRALVNPVWIHQFPESLAIFDPPGDSDHSLCLVSLSPSEHSGRKSFKYFSFVSTHSEFLPRLQASWSQSVGTGSKLFLLGQRLKLAKECCRNLNREGFGNIQQRTKDALVDLERIQNALLTVPTPDLVTEESQAREVWSFFASVFLCFSAREFFQA